MEKKVKVVISGDSSGFAASAKEAVDQLNNIGEESKRVERLTAGMARWRRELAEYARRQRSESKEQLTLDQQLNRLYERRAQIQARLASTAGNDVRQTAMKLRLAQVNEQIGGLEPQRDAARMAAIGGGGRAPGLWSRATGAAAGAAGRVRGAINSGIGMFAGGIAGLAGIAVATRQVGAVIRYAGEISDVADKVGVGVEAMQAFEIAGNRAGVTVEQMARGLRDMQVSQAKAMMGTQSEVEAFARLGVGLEDLRSKSPEALFKQIAAAVGKAPHSAQLLNDVFVTLGETGTNLLPALRDGFAETVAEIEKSGMVMDEGLISSMDSIGDRWGDLMASMRKPIATLVDWVLKAFTAVQKGIAWISSFWGAKFGGASWSDSLKAADQASAAIDAREAKRRERKPRAPEPVIVPKPEEKPKELAATVEKPAKALGSMPTADALARIGLFRGGFDPAQATRAQQLRELQSIKSRLDVLNSLMSFDA